MLAKIRIKLKKNRFLCRIIGKKPQRSRGYAAKRKTIRNKTKHKWHRKMYLRKSCLTARSTVSFSHQVKSRMV